MERHLAKCDLCCSSKGVMMGHYEDHLKKRLNIYQKYHGHLHIAVHYHMLEVMQSYGFDDPIKRNIYRELHERLVKNGLIECDKCRC